MANFDEAEFKRVVSTTKITQARQAPGRTGSFHRASTSKIRRAAGKILAHGRLDLTPAQRDPVVVREGNLVPPHEELLRIGRVTAILVLVQIVADTFKVCGGGRCPADTPQE